MLSVNPVINSSYSNKNKIYFYNQTNFTGRLPDKVYTEIRDIPGLKCAFCDKDMLTNEQIKIFIKSFAAASKNALENRTMEPFWNTEAFNFLKQLSAKTPQKSISAILNSPENAEKIKKLDPQFQFEVTQTALKAEAVTVKAPKVLQNSINFIIISVMKLKKLSTCWKYIP